MLIELCTPRSTGIREQNVHMIGMLLNLLHEIDDSLNFGDVSGNSNGFGAGALVWQSIQCLGGGVAGSGFAGGDDDE